MIKLGETIQDHNPGLGDLVTNYKQNAFNKNREYKKSDRGEKGRTYSLGVLKR